jgi:hypothetical protein
MDRQTYEVAAAHYGPDDWPGCAAEVFANTPKEAAQGYVEMHLADLDYPDEVRIRVRLGFETWLFDVTVISVPETVAKLVSEPKQGG